MVDHGKEDPEHLEREALALEKEAERLEDTAHHLEDDAHAKEAKAHRLEEEAHRERQEEENRGHVVEITMVVNGQPVTIPASKDETLAHVRKIALDKTQNLAQPPENWEIKDEAGNVLDPEKKVWEFCFGEKVTLFLSLKAGVAGV